MATVYIGIGSNLGKRGENLRSAIEALAPDVRVEKISSIYESEAQGVGEQPRFLNMVVQGATELTPHDLLKFLQSIEVAMGRKLNTHNLPRIIDLDILLHGQFILNLPELTIPHPRMHERAFVLVPLHEITPFHQCPPYGKAVADMLDELGGYEHLVWPAEISL